MPVDSTKHEALGFPHSTFGDSMRFALCYLIPLTLLFGCVIPLSSGTKITDEDMEKVIFGKTTYSEVVAMFGNPILQNQVSNSGAYYSNKCGENGDTIRVAVYSHSVMWGASMKTSDKRIHFNASDIACDVRESGTST